MMQPEDAVIYQVLADVELEDGTISCADLIRYLSGNWHSHVFSQPELEHAVEHCLAVEWIKVLTERDCEDDRVRWLDNPHQNWSEGGLYQTGRVDLTPAGWDAYVRLTEALHHRKLEDMHNESLRYIWRTPGVISMLSLSGELLFKEKEDIFAGRDHLAAGGLSAEHTIENIAGPYAIGPWWVTRFHLAPYGYRADITFGPADMNL